jgi:hypothetical protein
MDVDEPTSTSGRVTRGTDALFSKPTIYSKYINFDADCETLALRQAPPQRVLFGQQSDTPTRQTRTAGTQQNVNSPTPGGPSNHTNGAYTSNGGTAVSIVNYDPNPLAASTVKAIATPSNNPNYFRDLARRQKDRLRRNRGIEQARGMMLPGSESTHTRSNQLLNPIQLDLPAQIFTCAVFGLSRAAFPTKSSMRCII